MQKLNDWLQLGAAIGVIAGLLLVAFEIRQNEATTRVELNSITVTSAEEIVRSVQQESLARALARSYESWNELSVYERIVLHGYYEEAYLQLFREWLMVVRGVYSDGELEGYATRFISRVLSTEYGRAWWDEYKNDMHGGLTVRDLVDKLARQSPPESPAVRHKRVDARLVKELGQ